MTSLLFRVRMPADRSSISCEKVGLTCARSFASTAQKTNCPTGAEKPLRGVSAEMTDLELMQISVPFHMEGSPHGLGCYNQRTTATFFLYFSAVFSGFLSILIPFLTSCDLHPHVFHTCLWHFMWSKATPRRSNSGGALSYSQNPAFLLDEQHENRAEATP